MANFNFNQVILGGRLTADPELRTTQSGISVVSFGIAVSRRYSNGTQQPETDFFNVTAWRGTADFVARYFRKGSSICVTGTVQNNSWVDNQNVKHYRTDIIADEVTFVDSKGESGAEQEPPQGVPQDVSTPAEFKACSDDDLPF